MSREWLWWLGEFGLAATVAVVAGFVTKDVPISILYGLFIGTVFFILRQNSRVASQFHQEVKDFEGKALNLTVIANQLDDANPIMKQLAHSAKDEAIRLAKGAVDGEIVVKARNILQTAIEIYKQAKPGDKVFSTNYWSGYSTPQSDVYRRTVFDLAANGVEVTRVFVESTSATPEQKKHLREEMDRQKDHLHVRFIKESRLPPEARTNCVIVLNRYAFYANIKTWMPRGPGIGRVMEGDELKLFSRRDEVEKATELAETVIKLSEEYK